MERKSDTVRRLVAAGDFKAALRIAKDFRLGISKEDSDDMRRGYECMIHGAFYQSIGKTPRKLRKRAWRLCKGSTAYNSTPRKLSP